MQVEVEGEVKEHPRTMEVEVEEVVEKEVLGTVIPVPVEPKEPMDLGEEVVVVVDKVTADKVEMVVSSSLGVSLPLPLPLPLLNDRNNCLLDEEDPQFADLSTKKCIKARHSEFFDELVEYKVI